MPNVVVVGTQWGDEGKGKIVDLLAERSDLVVRFGGGNNAGHTLVVDGEKTILHLIPSGALHPGVRVLLGDAMVVDPGALLAEVDALAERGVVLGARQLLVSSRAHLILPYHRQLDELREGTRGALGTTRRGVGPAYEDKAARRGVRVGDLRNAERTRFRVLAALSDANARLERAGATPVDPEVLLLELRRQAERLCPHIVDAAEVLHQAIAEGRSVLFEGAQGALLDLDHGTYPFVTSSTTVGGGACGSAGVGPRLVDDVVGVSKAYVTRVGEGPFPTELEGSDGEGIRAAGAEYGATTGRPRRCGWLDLVALRYAVRISGVTALALTKLDVLSALDALKVCVGYRCGGQTSERFPDDAEDLVRVQPVLQEVEPLPPLPAGAVEDYDVLPEAARAYVQLIEQWTGVPVRWLSLGPGRDQTLERR